MFCPHCHSIAQKAKRGFRKWQRTIKTHPVRIKDAIAQAENRTSHGDNQNAPKAP